MRLVGIKGLLLGFLAGMVVFSACFLAHINSGEFMTFIAQSIVDNAIFCIMFIVVVLVTGISV